MVLATDWRARVTDLDARDASGNVLLWSWLFGSDDRVAIDVGAQLDTGETLVVSQVTLYQLAAFGESADVDKTASMVSGAATTSGSVILQRLTGLERGRYYRLEVLHGTAGNLRGASLLIHCPE